MAACINEITTNSCFIFHFPRFCGSMILLWGCQNKGDQCKDEYAFFKDSSSILKANMLIFNLSILFSANKFTHFGYYDLQSSGIQSLYVLKLKSFMLYTAGKLSAPGSQISSQFLRCIK